MKKPRRTPLLIATVQTLAAVSHNGSRRLSDINTDINDWKTLPTCSKHSKVVNRNRLGVRQNRIAAAHDNTAGLSRSSHDNTFVKKYTKNWVEEQALQHDLLRLEPSFKKGTQWVDKQARYSQQLALQHELSRRRPKAVFSVRHRGRRHGQVESRSMKPSIHRRSSLGGTAKSTTSTSYFTADNRSIASAVTTRNGFFNRARRSLCFFKQLKNRFTNFVKCRWNDISLYNNAATTCSIVPPHMKMPDIMPSIIQLFAHTGALRAALHDITPNRPLPALHKAMVNSLDKFLNSSETPSVMAAMVSSDKKLFEDPKYALSNHTAGVPALHKLVEELDKEKLDEKKLANKIHVTCTGTAVCEMPRCRSTGEPQHLKDTKANLIIGNDFNLTGAAARSLARRTCAACGQQSLKVDDKTVRIAPPDVLVLDCEKDVKCPMAKNGNLAITINDVRYHLTGAILADEAGSQTTICRDSEEPGSWYICQNNKRSKCTLSTVQNVVGMRMLTLLYIKR